MKKYHFFLLLVYLVFLKIPMASAQSFANKSLPFLKEKLKESKPDSNRVKLLLALSRALLFKSGAVKSDIDGSRMLLEEAQQLSWKLRDSAGQGNALLMEALLQNHEGKKNEGLRSAEKALAIFRKTKNLTDQAEAFIIIGQHYKEEGDELDIKLDYYEKAVALFLQMGNKSRAATTLTDIGDFKTYTRPPGMALKDLQRALVLYQSVHYKELQAVYDLLGENFSNMGDYINGIKYGLLAVQTAIAVRDTSLLLCTIFNRLGFSYFRANDLENAVSYYKKSLHIARKYHHQPSIQLLALNLSSALVKMNRPASALQVINRLDGETKPGEDLRTDVEIGYAYIRIYLKMKRFNAAEKYLKMISTIDLKLDAKSEAHSKVYMGSIFYYQQTNQYEKSYAFLLLHQAFCKVNNLNYLTYDDELWWFKADSALGKYQSAINHYQRYKAVNDSVFNEKKIRQVASLQIQYESDEKDKNIQLKSKDIQLWRKKAQLQQLQVRQERVIKNVVLISAILLVLLVIVLYNRYRLKQNSNLLLQAHQAEIDEQNSALITLNERQKVLLKEKEWLLREIHHRVKNNLQITMSLLNIQSSYMVNEDALEAIQNSQRRMQAMSLIHQKLYQSDNLALIDMSIYIPELVNYLKDSFDENHLVTFHIQTLKLELDIAQAVPLGLILNEAITNAIKYAFPGRGAGKITIFLDEERKGLYTMKVADDGVGLPAHFDTKIHDSLGMNLMRGLAEQLQGHFEISNNSGTTITVVFACVNLMETELNFLEQEA
ncbi:histidine kinase dimerization/phosphoacceptor domain -containing protein [Mucilaginibacter aquaedulcis]|uniref:histidine kinase dimerization/phosphoacceptor domain -containing protein n=1 Tax=Mucilaginibacter aquaedulcis TaxID=1187081 RepID=UPI0025B53694|nr:histidine kinase dimerization/phosphoacceptor domain -containing protein [Mucilaginibacter aquaedulcis]MDN3548877.1 histidine kinase dimerization/phosphoacceptor domain -containing protein [Mucilaginibacter aquaedulcis]